jgi:hypothetical protein
MHKELSMSAIAFEVMIEACSDPEGSGHRSVSDKRRQARPEIESLELTAGDDAIL